MTALYILLGVLAFLLLSLFSPVSLYFYYRDAPLLILRIWGIPIRLVPQKEKRARKTAKKSGKAEEKEKSSVLAELQETFREDGIGAVLHWLRRLALLLKTAGGRLLRAITVKRLRLEMRIGGEDAAAAALHYGEVCAVLFPLLTLLYASVRVKKREIRVQPDFLEAGDAVLAEFTCRISLWRLLGMLIALAFGMLRLYMSTNKEKTEDETEGKALNGRK